MASEITQTVDVVCPCGERITIKFITAVRPYSAPDGARVAGLGDPRIDFPADHLMHVDPLEIHGGV